MSKTMQALGRIRETRFGKKYIGDKAFYMTVLGLIVPIIIQNSITNFVSLLDNIMVGAVSINQMNGVSIANQLVFVFNLCVFGGVSASSIFGAQFFGAGDQEGVKHSFRYSLLVALGVSVLAGLIVAIFHDSLIGMYITTDNASDAAEMLSVGREYILIMMAGLIPFGISQAYAGILRVTGETKLPMLAAVASVLVNLVLNAVLIFGLFGFPEMKARGAAVATVISRYVELFIIVLLSHERVKKYPTNMSYRFLDGAYRGFSIPLALTKKITFKGLPLLANEAAWSMGMAMLAQLYSRLGSDVVAANTITSTLTNLFNVFFISMGTAASVLVGQSLGMNDTVGAKRNVRQIIFFQMLICVTIGAILFALSPLLPYCFKEADADIRRIASGMIKICAIAMPINGFAHCSYFILRSGGRTVITFLFDSAYTWLVPIPFVLALVTLSDISVVPIYAMCHALDLLKVALGYILLKKGVWIRNIVS
ncbi:MAG: MATE family efflux transporter [Clostridia bacterium]|nr:MATE family efflux transporter [Clostridia bacterium]